jgi:zinc transporter ZupT
MEIWQYAALFALVFMGGMAAMFFRNAKHLFPIIMSFCGAYILGVLILHLLPDIYSATDHLPQHEGTEGGAHEHHTHNLIGLWVIGGFLLQLLLEQISLGVEHGHLHDHLHSSRPSFAFQVMAALSVHAFVEGLPLAGYGAFHAEHHADMHQHDHLFLSVIFHKAPEAFALVLLMLSSHFKMRTIWICLIAFSLMSPLGALVGDFAQFKEDSLRNVIAIVVGTLLHIATTILFEGEHEHDEHHHRQISKFKLVAVFSGIVLSMLTLL